MFHIQPMSSGSSQYAKRLLSGVYYVDDTMADPTKSLPAILLLNVSLPITLTLDHFTGMGLPGGPSSNNIWQY